MLTSPEEAYTNYLEHVVGEAAVDPAVVRDTLRQLGYDDATIAVIMGEASAALPSSSSSSSSSFSSTSLKKESCAIAPAQSSPQRQRGKTAESVTAAAAASATSSTSSSMPSEMSRPPLHGAGRDQNTSVQSETASAQAAHFVQPPSIMHESKPTSHAATTSSYSSSMSSAASSSSLAKQSRDYEIERLDIGGSQTKSGNVSGGEVKAMSNSRDVETVPHDKASSSCSGASHDDLQAANTACFHPTLAEKAGEQLKFASDAEDNNNPNSKADESDVLARWMHEYRALLLSSAMPRRGSTPHADTPAKRLPREDHFDECHPVLFAEASSVASTCEAQAVDHRKLSWSATQERQPSGHPSSGHHHRTAAHQHKQGSQEDSGFSASADSSSAGYSGDMRSSSSSPSSSAASSFSSAPMEVSGDRHPHGATTLVVHRPSTRGCWCRHHAAAAAAAASVPAAPFRHVIPKATSTLFVPTCERPSPRRRAVSGRCDVAERDCRHPYREAQDVRIARASCSLAEERHRSQRCGGASQARAREVDATRQAQRTSRAEPTCGRRVPVMRDPVQPSVQPRSGLVTGRQGAATTLPVSARTDRVSLANSYRQAWERQERRTTVASREAAWDARYALLSCTKGTSKAS